MNNRFEQYLHTLSGRHTPETVYRVRCTLGDFMRYAKECDLAHWYEVTTGHINQWLAMKSRTVTPWTLHSYSRVLFRFFGWMYRNEFLLVNPWDSTLDRKTPPYNPRRVPFEAQASAVIDAIAQRQLNSVRNRAILEIAYGSGLRRCELARLSLGDVQGDMLRVRGKGNRDRLVPLGRHARRWVQRYLDGERATALKDSLPEAAVFVSNQGTRLRPTGYSQILKKGKLNHLTTLHGLRHACATHMLRNGASIRVLQKLLGHRLLSSTQIYTKVDGSDLRDLIDQHHPRG
jgi:integrase/recombinase XerD